MLGAFQKVFPLLELAIWTPEDRALVGDYGSGQALSDDQYRLLEPLVPAAKPGGRPRTTDPRRLLDGLFYLVRTGCQWRHLPPPPAFPPWPTVYGYMRAFLSAGTWAGPFSSNLTTQGSDPDQQQDASHAKLQLRYTMPVCDQKLELNGPGHMGDPPPCPAFVSILMRIGASPA